MSRDWRSCPEIECGPWASHPRTASFVCSCLSPLSPRRRRHDCSSRTNVLASEARNARLFAEAGRRFAIVGSRARNRCAGQQPCLAHSSKAKEEAATPRQPVALARAPGGFPRRSALEERRLPLALPQSSGRVRNSHVSLHSLSISGSYPRNTKTRRTCEQPVDVASSLWNPEEISE
jgi:hypothetical protein